MVNAVIVHNLVNPETGLTIKQENMLLQHKIPLDTLVEVNCDYLEEHGVRMFVVEHTRDCDGEPLYSLSFHKSEYFTKWNKLNGRTLSEQIEIEGISKAARMAMSNGHSDDSLVVIREA